MTDNETLVTASEETNRQEQKTETIDLRQQKKSKTFQRVQTALRNKKKAAKEKIRKEKRKNDRKQNA